MKVALKSDIEQIGGNLDRCSIWISKNNKEFICSITIQERKDGTTLITLIPNDVSEKIAVLKPDPTAKDYEWMAIPDKQKNGSKVADEKKAKKS